MSKYLVITSRRYDNDVVAYGPIEILEEAQAFMLKLAKHISDYSDNELEDNYHIETSEYFFDITKISDYKELEL